MIHDNRKLAKRGFYCFDGAKLQKAISRILERRGTPCEKDSSKRVVSLAEDVDMHKRWKYILKTIKDDALTFLI